MLKLALGLVGLLLLAACGYTPQTASAPTTSAGVGHPDNSYPGPRVY
ncbi:MAG TPA: hypothetical protein VG651_19000 [Stellaceae bacterium]|nr:hypothetical protein [Stellaceae bacterium]